MLHILRDSSKFSTIGKASHELLHKLEDKLARCLGNLKSTGKLDDTLYHSVFLTGKFLGSICGTPKKHKPNYPISHITCIISDSLNTLPKSSNFFFILPIQFPILIISPLNYILFHLTIPSCVHQTLNPYLLTSPSNSQQTCSCSTFSNSAHIFTILIAILFYHLSLATSDTFFYIFNDTTYQQRDGVAMGSPLGPILADFFLYHLESSYLSPTFIVFPPPYILPTICR